MALGFFVGLWMLGATVVAFHDEFDDAVDDARDAASDAAAAMKGAL